MKKKAIVLILITFILLINFLLAADDKHYLDNSKQNASLYIYIQGSEIFLEDQNGSIIEIGVSGKDDSRIIKNAIARLDKGSILLNGNFKLKETIDNLKSEICLKGIKDKTEFDCSKIESSALSLGEHGYSISTSNLREDIHAGDHEVYVSGSQDFHKGDFIKIVDDSNIIGFKTGELSQIVDVSNDLIRVSKPIRDSYTIKRHSNIRKLKVLDNITIENIVFIGPGMNTTQAMMDGQLLRNFTFKNNTVKYFGERALVLIDSLDCTIDRNLFTYIFAPDTGYSITLGNACENISIKNNIFQDKGRHYIVCTAGYGTNSYGGFCRNVKIFNNYFEDSTQEAINTHEPFIGPLTINNNTFISCDKGIEITNGNSYIYNNLFDNCGIGIHLFGDEKRLYNIHSNDYKNCGYKLLITIKDVEISGKIGDANFYLRHDELKFL